MPYSIVFEEGEAKKTARAFGKEVNVSPKHANQVCAAIRRLSVEKALKYLQDVRDKKQFVRFNKYAKKMPHRRGGARGRFPQKAARIVSKVLQEARANAEHKGLDSGKLRVMHATAYKASTMPRMRPRGRGGHGFKRMGVAHSIDLTNIEIVLKEA